MKAHGLEEQCTERRGIIGLRNLGATCYINSLLQNWYHLDTFRRVILSYDGEVLCITSSKDMIIYELQKVFLFLQASKRNDYNPKSFVDSMSLGYGEQQDVQEFTQLLLSRIDTSFQKIDRLKNAVSDHFKGILTYVTTCLTCGKDSPRKESFLELELSITTNDFLQDSLVSYLSPEYMTGSNQYACGSCKSHQNAKRQIRIDSLPPVLNIQLLRFVFDLKTCSKKKLKSKIRFTKYLNFDGLVNGNSNDLIYDLHAVLLHRGQTANSGHYVIRVFNEEYVLLLN